METGSFEAASTQEDTDFRVCNNCGENKLLKKFRPTSYKLANGTKKQIRRKTCRKCEVDARKAKGLCNSCYRPVKPGHVCCDQCLAIIRRSAKSRARQDRQAALDYYGRKCNYCNQSIEIFLTIDHIENNGAEHRKQINGKRAAGSTTYAWLRRNNYPNGFQTLCYNCNCAKGIYGEQTVKKALIH